MQVDNTIIITAVDGTIEFVNPAFERLTGYTREEAIGKTPRILQSGQHSREFYRRLRNTILSGRTWAGELIYNLKKLQDIESGNFELETMPVDMTRLITGKINELELTAREMRPVFLQGRGGFAGRRAPHILPHHPPFRGDVTK